MRLDRTSKIMRDIVCITLPVIHSINPYYMYICACNIMVLVLQKRTSSLPAGRVGATFDSSHTTDEQWMPSFSKVFGKKRTQ